MKRLSIIFVFATLTACTTQQVEQSMEILGGATQGLSNPNTQQVAAGLKAALEKGASVSGNQLSQVDGFLKNQAIKILFPKEFQKAEKTLRDLGMGSLADQAVVSFNRAAEKASGKAFPILAGAIQQLTFADAMNILMGPKDAATTYLKKTTTASLRQAFLPTVKQSANQVYATKYWDQIASNYNRIPLVKKVPSSISGYITDETLKGLFHRIEKEEGEIRDNPAARTSQILKSIFGYAERKAKSS